MATDLDGVPIEIVREVETSPGSSVTRGAGLRISWSNGKTNLFSSSLLRRHCPCAACDEARGSTAHQSPLSGGRSTLRVLKATAEEETDLQNVWAVGNYAIGISWGDKHSSGIYSWETLRALVAE